MRCVLEAVLGVGLLVPGVLCAACDSNPTPKPGASNPAPQASAASLSVGSKVVARQSGTSLMEGSVVEVKGEQITVETETGRGTQRFTAERKDVLTLPPPANRPGFGQGDIAYAKLGRTIIWAPVEVTKPGDPVEVRFVMGRPAALGGDSATLPASQLVTPSADVVQAVRSLQKQAQLIPPDKWPGTPRAAKDWAPKVGAQVVAYRNAWHSATVLKVEGERITVEPVAGGQSFETTPAQLAPNPPTALPPAKLGDIVLVPPKADDKLHLWRPGKVVGSNADVLRVNVQYLGERDVKQGSYVPLK